MAFKLIFHQTYQSIFGNFFSYEIFDLEDNRNFFANVKTVVDYFLFVIFFKRNFKFY